MIKIAMNFISVVIFSFIVRFPNDVELRISFIQYLVDNTDHSSTILYNLQLLEATQKLTFCQRLEVSRLRQSLSEAQITSQLHDSPLDQISQRNYEHKKMFSEVYLLKLNALINDHIEKATAASILFLQILRDDSPDIKKVDQCLVSLYNLIHEAFDIYNNNAAFDLLNMSGKRNFGLFLMKVLQREKEGSKVLKDYYERLKALIKKRNEIGSLGVDKDIAHFSDPIFIVKLNEVTNEDV